MRDPLTDDEAQARKAVEGRMAFVAAALFLAGALVAVIDRVGAPALLVTMLGPAIAIAGLIAPSFLVQAMRLSNFYVSGRAMPAKYVGLAMAGLAAALILPMTPPGPPGGLHAAMLAGLAAGLALAGFSSGPLLRKSGAYSLPDLFGMRFASAGIRLATALAIAALCCFVAFAGFQVAVRGIEETFGLSRYPAAVVAGFIVLIIVAPGGLAGSAWAAAIAAFVLSLALLMPLVILYAGGSPLPAPFPGREELWAQAMRQIALWNPAPAAPLWHGFATAAAVAIGICALAPLVSPMLGCSNARAASRAGVVACGWFVLLAAALLMGMAISALALASLAIGQRPDALPGFLYAASDKGLVTICGQAVASPRAAALTCMGVEGFGGRLDPGLLWASGRYLLTGVPELGRLSLAVTGLVSAGYLAVALALAAAGVQAGAAAIGHDLLLGVRRGSSIASRRLAVARLVMIALCLGLTYLTLAWAPAPQLLLALAILFAVAGVAPLLLLCVWSRATARDAGWALGAGVCAIAATIVLSWRDGAFQTHLLALGALGGLAAASLTGFATSLRRTESETRAGRIFVEGLFYGESDVMGADRVV